MSYPNKVDSKAATKEPVTLSGWYECTDGTWVCCPEVTSRMFLRYRQHYDRRPTQEEIDADHE